jgi:hypothetical protein
MKKAERLESVKEYYFSTKLAEIAEMKRAGKDVINLGIGNPDLPPPPDVQQELVQVIFSDGVNGYQSYRGIAEFRESIASWYEQVYGVKLKPEEEVLPLIGSKEGIFHVSMAFLNVGDYVMVPNPGYPAYGSVAKLLEANIVDYTLCRETDWQPDMAKIRKADLDRVKLFWLNTPHMPTGVAYKKEVLSELITLAQKHHFLIVNDNPYSFILNDRPSSLLELPGASEVCLELNSNKLDGRSFKIKL